MAFIYLFIYLFIYYEVVHRVHIYIENKIYEISVLNIKSRHQISNNFVHLFPGEVVIHRSKPTISLSNLRFRPGRGTHSFRTTKFGLMKLETSYSRPIALFTDEYFVLSQCTRLTDTHTDRQTDRQKGRSKNSPLTYLNAR